MLNCYLFFAVPVTLIRLFFVSSLFMLFSIIIDLYIDNSHIMEQGLFVHLPSPLIDIEALVNIEKEALVNTETACDRCTVPTKGRQSMWQEDVCG